MDLVTRLLTILLLLVSFSSWSLELEYGRYNVNAYSHADCIDTVCRIDFEETYASTPAVFFMDTVGFQNEKDAPSAIRILTVTDTYVEFEQQYPPNSRAPADMEQVPMMVIDYLVIEHGVHDFDGVKVLVGSVNTARYRTKINNSDPTNNRDSRVRARYATESSNEILSFSSIPAILHQVQTVNNPDDLWLTSVVPRVTRSNFDIALERLEIDGRKSLANRDYPQQPEEIAYLAAVGQGEKDGIKFQIRNQQTSSSLSSSNPVTQGCETFATYDELDVVPVIIGKMNSRQGNNGAFVRRCRLETARASFMVDEDQDLDSERGHVAERIGFILFEVPFEVNQCTQFTGAAQTWSSDGEMDLGASVIIEGSVPDGRVGFDNLTQPDWGSGNPKFCDGYRCATDSSLKVPQYSFASYTPGNGVLNPADGDVLSPGHYKKISIKNGRTVTLSSGDYFMEDFLVSGGATVLVSGDVRVHSHKIELSGNSSVNYSTAGGAVTTTPNQLHLISHGIDTNVDYLNLNNNNSVKNGVYVSGSAKAAAFIISESLIDINGGQSIVYGAAASLYLKMYNTGQLLGDISSCNEVSVQEMLISPTSASEIIDSAVAVTFSIVDSEGAVDSSVYGNLNLTHTGGSDVCWKSSEAGACISDTSSVPISAGIVTYYLYSSVEVDVNITATWVEKDTVTDSAGIYSFVNNGYVFEPSPLTMIAGQDTTATIKAVDSSGNVITDYDGAKVLSISETSKITPSTGTYDATLLTQNVTFIAGEAQVTVNYVDAGQVSLSIQEASDGFKGDMLVYSRPHTFAICNITSTGLNAGYNGTTTSGNGFAKAGESFSVTIKPVRWLGTAISGDSSGDGDNDVVADALCSKSTTPNYYTDGALFAGVNISHALHTPSGGQPGNLAGEATYSFANTGQAKDGLIINGLSWSEVGSLWLQADYSDYMLGAVEQGVAAIGRFYPDHFSLKSGVVNEGQSDFTYMLQGYSAAFEVEAQNAAGTVTQNYESFAYDIFNASNNNRMTIQLKAIDASQMSPTENDLTSRIDMDSIATGWESDWSSGTLGISASTLIFNKIETSSSPLKTTPDGPYRVQMGLEVNSGSIDCTTIGCTYFDSTDAYRNDGSGDKDIRTLPEELDMRYGRMRISNVGGNTASELPVPLTVEYWDSSRFVANTLDDDSAFNGANYCRTIIWSEGGASLASFTSGVNNVTNGLSSDLMAQQNQVSDAAREQVKLWLRIGEAPSTFENGQTCVGSDAGGLEYLHYNWDGRGDENPTAVVTFGIYRGNDRIIFRGEPGMY
ncbi:DUF6701 domain-containing protein [Vibrio gallaecicus]|uniref:DUF6701 domain-containing protein n=1 Tax=Vibrio gallaecicus TaxID=552386 RepID=A0ABV4NAL4_9VIBR